MPIPPRDAASSSLSSGCENSPTIVHVELGTRSYPIVIVSDETRPDSAGESGLDFPSFFLKTLGDCTHVVLIEDAAVAATAGQTIVDALGGSSETPSILRVSRIEIASGETSKSTDVIDRLWNELIECEADRRTVVIAVGGGVVGDLAGFAAATFTRGLRFVQIPTTLLAMVDSSVGGKTGINLPGGKNMVGSFWQPHLVWIETGFLATLPEREYVSGLAEVIKYGVVEDAEFFEYLDSNIAAIVAREPGPIRHAIAKSCQSKSRVVADDERETTGRRAILNYGHTFAHAIESSAGYGVMLHGEAVAIGMQMAAHVAVALGRCDQELLDRQTRLLHAAKLPLVWAAADPQQMIPVMARDKKVAHGKLRFVLPDSIGHVELVGDVPIDKVIAAIEACRMEAKPR